MHFITLNMNFLNKYIIKLLNTKLLNTTLFKTYINIMIGFAIHFVRICRGCGFGLGGHVRERTACSNHQYNYHF